MVMGKKKHNRQSYCVDLCILYQCKNISHNFRFYACSNLSLQYFKTVASYLLFLLLFLSFLLFFCICSVVTNSEILFLFPVIVSITFLFINAISWNCTSAYLYLASLSKLLNSLLNTFSNFFYICPI